MKFTFFFLVAAFAQADPPLDSAIHAADLAVLEAQKAYCSVRADLPFTECLEREAAQVQEIDELTRLGETVSLDWKKVCPYENLSLSRIPEHDLKMLDAECEKEINKLNELIDISSENIANLLGRRDYILKNQNIESYANKINGPLNDLSKFYFGNNTSFSSHVAALRAYRLALQKQLSNELSGRSEVLRSLVCIQTIQFLIDNNANLTVPDVEYQRLRQNAFDAMFPDGPSKFLEEFSCQRPSADILWDSYFP